MTVALMIVLSTLAGMVQPILASWGIDRIINDGASSVIWILFFALLGSGVAAWVFNFLRAWLTAKVVGGVVLKLREDAFGAVMERDLSFYDTNPSGKIVSRVTSDSDDFSNVVTLTMNLLSQILLVVGITIVLFSRNVTLAFIALAITPVFVIMAVAFRRIARETTQQSQRSTALVNSRIQEAMNGIAIAKNFRQEQTLYDEFLPINRQAYQVTLKQGLVFAAIFPALFFVAGLGTVLLVFLGGRRAIAGEISAGEWFLFFQSVMIFWMPLTSIASFLVAVSAGARAPRSASSR